MSPRRKDLVSLVVDKAEPGVRYIRRAREVADALPGLMMPREALRRLDQACAVRRVASNASTSIAVVLYRAPTSRPRHNKLELGQAFESSSSSIYSQPIRPTAIESSSRSQTAEEDSTVPASYNRSLWRTESTGAEHIQTRTAAEAARNQVIVVR